MLQVGAIVQFLLQIIHEMTSFAYFYLDLFTSSHGGNQNIQGGCVTLMWPGSTLKWPGGALMWPCGTL